MRKFAVLFLLLLAVAATGCSSINFMQVSPEAKDFHPSSVAVMPATVGEFESSRDIVDTVVSRKLLESGLFENVIDNATIRVRIGNSSEFANEVGAYIQKLNTLGISDAATASKLKESLGADALLLTYVTSWGYGRAEGNKLAKVGLGIKLIDASRGTIILKANHELVEEYWMIKPDLKKMAEKLLAILLKEMPIEKAVAKSNSKSNKPDVKAEPAKAPAAQDAVKSAPPGDAPTIQGGMNSTAPKVSSSQSQTPAADATAQPAEPVVKENAPL